MPHLHKFVVGDRVEYGMTQKGVIVGEFLNEYTLEITNYDTYLYESKTIISPYRSYIRHCIGLRSKKKLCSVCEYQDLCSHSNMQEVIQCEFSEFGQWRKDKKSMGMPLDTEACTKCKSRSYCWGHRFIQNES